MDGFSLGLKKLIFSKKDNSPVTTNPVSDREGRQSNRVRGSRRRSDRDVSPFEEVGARSFELVETGLGGGIKGSDCNDFDVNDGDDHDVINHDTSGFEQIDWPVDDQGLEDFDSKIQVQNKEPIKAEEKELAERISEQLKIKNWLSGNDGNDDDDDDDDVQYDRDVLKFPDHSDLATDQPSLGGTSRPELEESEILRPQGSQMMSLSESIQDEFDNLDVHAKAERHEPMTEEQFHGYFDADGRIVDENQLRRTLFKGGVEEAIRQEVWQFLFELYPWNSTARERDVMKMEHVIRYDALKARWRPVLKQIEKDPKSGVRFCPEWIRKRKVSVKTHGEQSLAEEADQDEAGKETDTEALDFSEEVDVKRRDGGRTSDERKVVLLDGMVDSASQEVEMNGVTLKDRLIDDIGERINDMMKVEEERNDYDENGEYEGIVKETVANVLEESCSNEDLSSISSSSFLTSTAPTSSVHTSTVPTSSAPTSLPPTSSVHTSAVPTSSVHTSAVSTSSGPTTSMLPSSVPTSLPPTSSVYTSAVPTSSVHTSAVSTSLVHTSAVSTSSVHTSAVSTSSGPTSSSSFDVNQPIANVHGNTVDSIRDAISEAMMEEPLNEKVGGCEANGSVGLCTEVDRLMEKRREEKYLEVNTENGYEGRCGNDVASEFKEQEYENEDVLPGVCFFQNDIAGAPRKKESEDGLNKEEESVKSDYLTEVEKLADFVGADLSNSDNTEVKSEGEADFLESDPNRSLGIINTGSIRDGSKQVLGKEGFGYDVANLDCEITELSNDQGMAGGDSVCLPLIKQTELFVAECTRNASETELREGGKRIEKEVKCCEEATTLRTGNCKEQDKNIESRRGNGITEAGNGSGFEYSCLASHSTEYHSSILSTRTIGELCNVSCAIDHATQSTSALEESTIDADFSEISPEVSGAEEELLALQEEVGLSVQSDFRSDLVSVVECSFDNSWNPEENHGDIIGNVFPSKNGANSADADYSNDLERESKALSDFGVGMVGGESSLALKTAVISPIKPLVEMSEVTRSEVTGSEAIRSGVTRSKGDDRLDESNDDSKVKSHTFVPRWLEQQLKASSPAGTKTQRTIRIHEEGMASIENFEAVMPLREITEKASLAVQKRLTEQERVVPRSSTPVEEMLQSSGELDNNVWTERKKSDVEGSESKDVACYEEKSKEVTEEVIEARQTECRDGSGVIQNSNSEGQSSMTDQRVAEDKRSPGQEVKVIFEQTTGELADANKHMGIQRASFPNTDFLQKDIKRGLDPARKAMSAANLNDKLLLEDANQGAFNLLKNLDESISKSDSNVYKPGCEYQFDSKLCWYEPHDSKTCLYCGTIKMSDVAGPENTSADLKQYMEIQAKVHAGRQVYDVDVVCKALRIIDKDVPRTDRELPYFSGNANPNLFKLRDALITYSFFHPDVGYAQGMNDVMSRFFVVMESEANAYWMFCNYMEYFKGDFMENDMLRKICLVEQLLMKMDRELYDFFVHLQLDLIFCHRWLLLSFKREFSYKDGLRIFEIMSSRHLEVSSVEAEMERSRERARELEKDEGSRMEEIFISPEYSFDVFVCVAMLQECRDVLMSTNDVASIYQILSSLPQVNDLDTILSKAEDLFFQYCRKSTVDCFQLIDEPVEKKTNWKQRFHIDF